MVQVGKEEPLESTEAWQYEHPPEFVNRKKMEEITDSLHIDMGKWFLEAEALLTSPVTPLPLDWNFGFDKGEVEETANTRKQQQFNHRTPKLKDYVAVKGKLTGELAHRYKEEMVKLNLTNAALMELIVEEYFRLRGISRPGR